MIEKLFILKLDNHEYLFKSKSDRNYFFNFLKPWEMDKCEEYEVNFSEEKQNIKSQFIKLVSVLTEKEIADICEAINQVNFEYGWDDPSKNFKTFLDWCWEDK